MIATLLLLALAAPLQDSVRVWSELSGTDVAVGQTVTLRIHVESRGAGPDPFQIPPLPSGLRVEGTRDFSQIQVTLPGGRLRSLRREVVIRATAAGRFRIPPVEITIDGRTHRTRDQYLAVSPARAPAPAGPAGSIPPGTVRGRDEVTLQASLSETTAFVGQQVTLRSTLRIADDVRARLRRAPDYFPPDGAGFWVQDFGNSPQATTRVLAGGSGYVEQRFARAYFPISPGHFVLPPAKVTYDVRRGFLYAPEPQELFSDSLRLTVVPLPVAGRPDAFAGAVGRFGASAWVEPAIIAAGEAAALIVEIEGEGNIKALPPPRLPELPGLQVFPPRESAEVDPIDGIVTGTKRFTWVIVPEEPGPLVLPAIEYAHFDPDRVAYAVTRTEPLRLEVTGGADRGGSAGTAASPSGLRPLREAPGTNGSLSWVRSRGFLALQALPLLLLGTLTLVRRRASASRPHAQAERLRLQAAALSALRPRAAGRDADFLRQLGLLLRGWIELRFPSARATTPSASAPDTLRLAMIEGGVSDRTADAALRLLGRIEEVRFDPDPASPDVRTALLDEAERMRASIDEEAGRRRPSGAGGVRTGGLLALALLAGAASASAAPDDLFDRAVASYHEGEFQTAKLLLEDHLALRPADVAAWYNLGNTCHELGDPGCATWAWLRALRLAPRDADLRANLALVGADVGLIRAASPPVPFNRDESLLLASLAWLAGSLLVGLGWIAGRHRRASFAGGAAMVASLLLVAAGVDPRGRGHAVALHPELALRLAPTLHGEEIVRFQPGTGLRILERREDWLRVIGPGEREGWVEVALVGFLD